jgi:DNA polymerase-1
MSKKTITIIDTFGFFFRSFYALPPLSNKQGFPTGLLTGFTNFISTLHKDHSSDYIVFALDSKGPTFRNEIDPNYKANRAAPPEELSLQLPIAIEWIEKMGFKTMSQSGFEADDIIASLSDSAVKAGMDVRIVSHDKDLYQLIQDDHVVLVDAIKRKVINEAECFDKHGIHPCQFTDFQSLLGDSADNVPGVKGVGKVTAQKLLTQFETLDNIYKNIDSITPAGVQKKLIADEDNAWMSRKLVTLKRDLYDDIDFEPFLMHEENPFIPIYDELRQYEMNGILRVLHAKGLVDPDQPKTSVEEEAEEKSSLSYKAHLISDDATLEKIVATLKEDDVVAFDTETTGLDYHNDTLVGFSFAVREDEAYYVAIAHNYLGVPDQVSLDAALKAINKILTCKIVGHNIKFDLHFLAKLLKIELFDIHADTMVMAWLENPERQVALDKLSERYLDHEMISFKDTVKKGETFASVELEDACKYAAEDALITLKLFNLLSEKMTLLKSEHILKEAKEVEYPFVSTLLRMEREGVKIDISVLEQFKTEVASRLGELTTSIYEQAGSEFNINSTKQLGVILFETLELPVQKKTKTGYSTDEKVLNALKDEHDIIPLLLEYREIFKLFSTYIEPLLDLAQKDEHHRIYTSFVQTGTATGRLSSKNPNLQNIPTKTELGRRIREAFVASEGKMLIGIDYSQIELRLLAHFSQDPVLLDAFNANKDIHRQTAVALFGEEDADTKRHIAKTVNFGLLYGMGPKKLSDTLGITTKEAKEIITRYFESFPTVKSYFSSIVDGAKEEGYVETLLGRRRYFDFASATPMLKAAYERESVNTLFQGSAADLIKLSMNKIDEVIRSEALDAKMLLQIHDELIFEVSADKAELYATRFSEIMESIHPLHVTLKTSLNIASHWGALK